MSSNVCVVSPHLSQKLFSLGVSGLIAGAALDPVKFGSVWGTTIWSFHGKAVEANVGLLHDNENQPARLKILFCCTIKVSVKTGTYQCQIQSRT